MKKTFTITTNKETAEQIKLELLHGATRTFEFTGMYHEQNYSVIQLGQINDNSPIDLEDIFWLGHHASSRLSGYLFHKENF